MRVGLGGDFAELVDDMLRRGQVGVAHAEIDDVTPGLARGMAQGVDLRDDIGRQALDAVEFVRHGAVSVTDCRLRRERAYRLERDLSRITAITLALVVSYFALNAVLMTGVESG